MYTACRAALEAVVGPIQDAELQGALEAVAKLRVGLAPWL
jgi:hypothetical protein